MISPKRPWLIGLAAVIALLVGAVLTHHLGIARQAVPPTLANQAYASASASEKLDLYRPPGPGPFPVVVYIHGGAFKFGDKRDIGGFAADVRKLGSLGIAVASINYRMSGEAHFPAAVADAKAAVRWLRAHSKELLLDPEAIGVWGKSAGANIALMVAFTPQDASLYEATLGMTDVSDAVQAAVAMYAPTNFLSMDSQARAAACGSGGAYHDAKDSPESLYVGAPIQEAKALAEQASPATHVSADVPPVLLQAGTGDCVVPFQQTKDLHDVLLSVAGPQRAKLVLIPGAGHADSKFDAPANLVVVGDFLASALRHSR